MSSNEQADSRGDASERSEGMPRVGEQVWVECGDYRTLAYRDAKGVWRTVSKNEKINVTKVLGGG
jgi:hypothetical protein